MKSNKSNTEIEVLITKVIRCEASAQRQMYDLLVLKMYNTVYRILKNREDTQDCLQNAFGVLFRKIDMYDSAKGTFLNWVTRVFINEALGMLRKRKLRFEEINDAIILPIDSNSPLDQMEAESILKLIHSLPDTLRVIFNLYEIEGYSHKEIATILGIGESSSRTYLMRAKIKLKEIIEASNYDHPLITATSQKRRER